METGLQTLRSLSLAVMLHSGPDRRSEMAQYARRSPPNPRAAPRSPTHVCLCLFRFDRMTLCVCVIRFPCHSLGPGSITAER